MDPFEASIFGILSPDQQCQLGLLDIAIYFKPNVGWRWSAHQLLDAGKPADDPTNWACDADGYPLPAEGAVRLQTFGWIASYKFTHLGQQYGRWIRTAVEDQPYPLSNELIKHLLDCIAPALQDTRDQLDHKAGLIEVTRP